MYTTQHGVIQAEGKTPSTRCCFEFDALAEVSGGRRVGLTVQGSGVRRRIAPGILLSRPERENKYVKAALKARSRGSSMESRINVRMIPPTADAVRRELCQRSNTHRSHSKTLYQFERGKKKTLQLSL